MAKYFGVSERDTLKSWTVPETVLSVAGFAVAGFAVAGFAVAGFAVAGFAVAAARSLIV